MRVQNWPSLLYLHLEDAPQFEWGKSDCVLWCADWIRQATGEDLAAEAIGKYSTEQGANDYLATLGFQVPSELADEYLDRVSPLYAQRGDIILHPEGALGICDGTYSHFLLTNGKTRLLTSHCLMAWRV